MNRPSLFLCILIQFGLYLAIEGVSRGKPPVPALVSIHLSEKLPADVLHEARMNACETIKFRGYPCTVHKVTTEDGYILTLFRIEHGRNANKSATQKNPVFLQHGLLDSAWTWVSNFENQSLAFLLADQGYDVWLGNTRGNVYSRAHKKLKPDQNKFWKWSFDEIARYDVPATIDYVLSNTGAEEKKVYYVGHSQGTLIAFAAFSEQPALMARVKLFVALCPVARVGNLQGPIRAIVPFAPAIALYIKTVGTGEFAPDSQLSRYYARKVCGPDVDMEALCEDLFDVMDGMGEYNMNTSRVPVYFSHFPAGTSVRNMQHYAQGVNSHKFRKYDHGPSGNLIEYGKMSPPEYNVRNITVRTALLWSEIDNLADKKDVEWLITQLPNIVFNRQYNLYGHGGFVWSSHAAEDIYKDVLDLLDS